MLPPLGQAGAGRTRPLDELRAEDLGQRRAGLEDQPDGGTDAAQAGCGEREGRFDLNDVSFLFPLPATAEPAHVDHVHR